MHDTKDTFLTILFMGYTVPLAFLTFAMLNVAEHVAYVPADEYASGNALHGIANAYTDAWRVYGQATFNVGLAVGLYAWYVLANRADLQLLTFKVMIPGILMIAGGFVAFVVGFFV